MARWVSAAALVVGLLLSSSQVTVAAADLQSLLASPPSSDWDQPAPGSGALVGQFTAQSYDAYGNRGSATPAPLASDLVAAGFVAGYAGTWFQSTTNDELVERVFEFRNSVGATVWYSGVKDRSESLKEHQSDIRDAAQIPDSFGIVLVYPNGTQWRVDFRKGNLVFVVHADSSHAGEDLSTLAVGQARAEWNTAPARFGTATNAGSVFPTWFLPVGGGIIAAIFAVTVGVIVLIWLLGRRRRVTSPGPQLSPDGRYWWDGTSWQPTGTGGG